MVIALALDQVTKVALVLAAPVIASPHELPVFVGSLFDGWITIEAGANAGLAFSAGSGVGALAGVIAAFVGVIVAIDLALAGDVLPARVNVALGLVLGGALGNLLDRLRTGSVVDFIRLDLPVLTHYILNVADVALCVGVLLLVISGPVPWLHWWRAIGASRHIRGQSGEPAPPA
jgi:signal peptidase II